MASCNSLSPGEVAVSQSEISVSHAKVASEKSSAGTPEKPKKCNTMVEYGGLFEEPPLSHPVWKKVSLKNGEINKMTKIELKRELESHHLDSRGHYEVLKKRLKAHYKRLQLMRARVKVPNVQSYDYLLVIDFEATCDHNKGTLYQHEIIEFPVILVDCCKRKIVDEFHSFVRPHLNPKLSDFCTVLTGITQNQVDASDTFPTVLENVETWMAKHLLGTEKTFAIVTDGPWDMGRFMYLQCHFSRIPFPTWCLKWINIRKAFSSYYRCRHGKIATMLENLEMEFIGNLHSGLDDSRNIARIAIRLLEDGCILKENERLLDRKRESSGTAEIKDLDDSFIVDIVESDNVKERVEDIDFVEENSGCDSEETRGVAVEVLRGMEDLSLSEGSGEKVEEESGHDGENLEDLLTYYSLQRS